MVEKDTSRDSPFGGRDNKKGNEGEGRDRSMKSSSKSSSKSQGAQSSNSTKGASEDRATGLRKLFVTELRDILWAEKALTKALPKMALKATSPELKQAITHHASETEEQVTRLEEVFANLSLSLRSEVCPAMVGLIKEADEVTDEMPEGIARDMAIIFASQKVEHYEMASYASLSMLAEILGEEDVAILLDETLEEEMATDQKLSLIAIALVSEKGTGEDEEDDATDTED